MTRNNNAVIITAAGSSSRMGSGVKKEYRTLEVRSVLSRSLLKFYRTDKFSHFVITLPRGHSAKAVKMLESDLAGMETGPLLESILFTEGGGTRQISVLNGLRALAEYAPELVLVHDGARPWVPEKVILDVLAAAEEHGACVPVIPAKDAVKELDASGFVRRHIEKALCARAQTPQGFIFRDILRAHEEASAGGEVLYSDDAEVYSVYIGRVFSVEGSQTNKKITWPGDI